MKQQICIVSQPDLTSGLGRYTINHFRETGYPVDVVNCRGSAPLRASTTKMSLFWLASGSSVRFALKAIRLPSGDHTGGGEVHGLLAGTALAVHGGARHLVAVPGHEPAGAGDVAGLRPDRVHAAEHDVVHGDGVDVNRRVAVQERLHPLQRPVCRPGQGRGYRLAAWPGSFASILIQR